jgi:NAD-dependent DNA ligase
MPSVQIVCFIFNWKQPSFQTQYEGLEAARAWGFKVPKEANR